MTLENILTLNFCFVLQNIFACLKLNRLWLVSVSLLYSIIDDDTNNVHSAGIRLTCNPFLVIRLMMTQVDDDTVTTTKEP